MIDKRYVRLGSIALTVLLAAACTRHVSRGISPDGHADQVVFPSVDKVVLKEGTYPNIDSLRQIGPGVTKDQLYELIGRPHFREGYYGVREWDYLFHFRKEGEVVTCQYKVIFDKDYRGQEFHWLPLDCAGFLAEKKVSEPKHFNISGDALFEFDRYDMQDLLPGGRQAISEVAEKLKAPGVNAIQVIGHTDRLGGDSHNLLLSQRRAMTVRQLLIDDGVDPALIIAQGVGAGQQVKDCDSGLAYSDLVECLQPNRRVEIVASGLK